MKKKYHFPFLFYGVLTFIVGMFIYLVGVLLGIPRYIFDLHSLYRIQELLVWYSGIPIILSLALACIDFFLFFDTKRFSEPLRTSELANRSITVALTAYNDEASIGESVADFLAHPNVKRVIVVSNNSSDGTIEVSAKAGAITFNEKLAGYGRCVFRCIVEAVKHEDTDLIVLCEGDCTFVSADIDKLLAYAPHADIVNGTRTTEILRQRTTQLSTFMLYGNVFVAKLLEAKHFGRCTLTDVGTTYKLFNRRKIQEMLHFLNPGINLEFNAHFLDTALKSDFRLLECPITFHPRVGQSKGGNANNWKGFTVGLKMIRGIIFGWKPAV